MTNWGVLVEPDSVDLNLSINWQHPPDGCFGSMYCVEESRDP
jgi:hypothetical protein